MKSTGTGQHAVRAWFILFVGSSCSNFFLWIKMLRKCYEQISEVLTSKRSCLSLEIVFKFIIICPVIRVTHLFTGKYKPHKYAYVHRNSKVTFKFKAQIRLRQLNLRAQEKQDTGNGALNWKIWAKRSQTFKVVFSLSILSRICQIIKICSKNFQKFSELAL